MPPVEFVGKMLRAVKKWHLKLSTSQCGKSIPLQSMNPGCGYEIVVSSLNTSEDVKSTICCQGSVMCISDMGLWKTSHPSSSQSRGRNIRTTGRQSPSNPFTQTLPISQDLQLWNFPQNWKEDKMLWLDIKSYGNSALGNAVNHRDAENLCGEGTARHALLTVGQPSEKETGFKILTQTCMHHNLEKLCTEMDDTESMNYAQNNIQNWGREVYTECLVFSNLYDILCQLM